MRAALEQFHSDGFEILSVSLDHSDRMSQEDLQGWIQENGMTWRHVWDGQGFGSPLATAYHVSGVPSLFLIGPDRELVATDSECRGEQLSKTLRRELRGSPAQPQ